MSARKSSSASSRHARETAATWGRSPLLLDVNVLVALAWPNHVHHAAALAWFGNLAQDGFATCPVTQSGFVRISSNARAIPGARSPREAREVLRRIVALRGHVFWIDDIDLAGSEHIAWERLGGHSQVTDAHLLAIAIRHGGKLATFDRTLADLAPEAAAGPAVVLVPA
ncbi:MAG TPA: TA system VapC family ribonuclease toxin [Polyangia bacterium]